MITVFFRLLLLLCAGHALCDYALQSDFIAKGKNHKTPFPGMASWQILLAHCLMHAGMVLLIAGSVWMAFAELVIHYITDWAKCEGIIDFNQDQFIHYACKGSWALIAYALIITK